jgi:dienelactone hydrolase
MVNKFHLSTSWILVTIFLIGISFQFCSALQVSPDDHFQSPYTHEYEKEMEEKMKQGIDSFLTKYTVKVVGERERFWDRRFDSPENYKKSIAQNRKHLQEILGIVEPRDHIRLVVEGEYKNGTIISETSKCIIYSVRWNVIDGLESEGLLLMPKGEVKASAVVIPDADESPESYAGIGKGNGLALKLAEGGTQVLIPVLINRETTYSGSDNLTPYNPWRREADPVSVWTNQTHREWIHRQGYIMGRHIIGMEVQKILAAVDWLTKQNGGKNAPVGVMGYGEGGLLAFYSAALDTRIDVSLISGYFAPREELWREPVYRNVWGLLKEFGDAEIASLIAPRSLIIENAPVPEVSEPVPVKEGQRNFAVPGELTSPSDDEVKNEIQRLLALFPENSSVEPDVIFHSARNHASNPALKDFADHLGVQINSNSRIAEVNELGDSQTRQQRVFFNMQEYIQDMIPTSERNRYSFLKGDFSNPEKWDEDMESYRKLFYEELVGKIPEELLDMNPKIRQIYDEPGWKGYEVILDVWDGVFSWGILAVPNDIKKNEKRPAVVLQHGYGGLPTTPISVKSYNKVLQALANRGFVVFAPHNPYKFNVRKANVIKTSIFSVIIPQHQQILNYLNSLEYVDGTRIALYGKSWGGRTAQRVPIVLKGYSTIISSAYFNDWVRKTVSPEYRNSYFFTASLGIYEWNMANTFTHAEMAALIVPRPFMVESGYTDAVAAHEMVAYEFAKVRRLYYLMGIADRVELEFFNGGHEINGEGTFDFLHKHLNWPAPESPTEAQEISRL